MPQITKRETLIATPWVNVILKTFDAEPYTYYVVEPPPYTAIIAFTRDGQLILIEQFRPAVEEIVLEMPAGTVEEGEDPSDCALRELLEETGYRSETIESLGWMYPDAGRMTNKIWGFVIRDAVLDPTAEDAEVVGAVPRFR